MIGYFDGVKCGQLDASLILDTLRSEAPSPVKIKLLMDEQYEAMKELGKQDAAGYEKYILDRIGALRENELVLRYQNTSSILRSTMFGMMETLVGNDDLREGLEELYKRMDAKDEDSAGAT